MLCDDIAPFGGGRRLGGNDWPRGCPVKTWITGNLVWAESKCEYCGPFCGAPAIPSDGAPDARDDCPVYPSRATGRPKPKISKAKRARIFERDGHACLACGSTEDLTLDHIVHWSKGGGNEDTNLRTLCHSCNSRRGDRHLKEVDL
ncbi:HNH endonuclease [Streptomyces sp. 5-10]|uniref:HNH endonuclease n=1 Tax=Streptomyces sp. 5-10 TaxID=878925 RepID=UPI00168BA74F|nr:HNH endonuclease [Streptomyces sp. 5-10]MBD3004759.1 HNH endonuclease [Streptomyces sp. 5-10]